MWNLLKNTIDEFLDDDCMSFAASIAFYTMFSLAPLLLIVLTLCGLFLDPADVHGQLSHEISDVVGAEGADQVEEMIASADRPGRGWWGTVFSIGTLLFGATGVMVELQFALNRVWQVKPDPDAGGIWNFIVKRLISLAMLLGIAFVLLVSLAVSWAIEAVRSRLDAVITEQASTLVWLFGHEFAWAVVATALFAAMFKFLPDANIAWRDVGVGAVLTALLFVLGKYLIGWYLSTLQVADSYGAAGSLAVILIWVYYSAMIVLLGAEFTHSWARSRGHRTRPLEGATRVIETEIKVRPEVDDDEEVAT